MGIKTVYDMTYKQEVEHNDPTTSLTKIADYYRKYKLYKWDDEIEFYNTKIISKAAEYFKKYGRYNDIDVLKSPREWKEWWDREEYRRLYGITLPIATVKGGGISDKDLKQVWIPGEMYGHLNYGPINRTKDPDEIKLYSVKDAINNDIEIAMNTRNNKKLDVLLKGLKQNEIADSIYDFPDFWDGHYHYWIANDFAGRIGMDLAVFKARRKGFSYIGGWDAFNTYDLIPGSNTILIAFDEKYLTKKDKLMYMVIQYSDFINKHTDWAKERIVDNIREIQSGFRLRDGTKEGFFSSVMALSCRDNPDVARGIKYKKCKWEECFGKGTKIRMADHSLKSIEDIKVGDFTMAPNGFPQRVIGTTSGISDLYKVEQTKGISYIVNDKHKLVVRYNTPYNKDKFEKLITPIEFLELSDRNKRQHVFGYKIDSVVSNVLESKLNIKLIGKGDYYGITVDGNHKLLLKDGTVVHNCGSNPLLASTYESTNSAAETGGYIVGQNTFWATIGSNEADYKDFVSVFYKPLSANCLPFDNLFDVGQKGKPCGFFFSHLMNYEGGGMDEHGNSLFDKANQLHEKKRQFKKENSKEQDFEKWDAERVTEPAKALFRKSNNIFSKYAKVLNNCIERIDRDPQYKYLGICGRYELDKNQRVRFVTNEELQANGYEAHPELYDINSLLPDHYDLHGCIVEYAPPHLHQIDLGHKIIHEVPGGIYSIWHDPYATDKDGEGGQVTMKDSTGVAIVFERSNNLTRSKGCRVMATWIGRPDTTEEYNRQLLYLAMRYNTLESLAFENDRGDVYKDFKMWKALKYLAPEPELLSLRELSGKTGRKFGMSISKNAGRKAEGARMFRDMLGWHISKDNESGDIETFAQYLHSRRFMRELLMWNANDNFDCVSAAIIGAYNEREAIDKNFVGNVEANTTVTADAFWERDFF